MVVVAVVASSPFPTTPFPSLGLAPRPRLGLQATTVTGAPCEVVVANNVGIVIGGGVVLLLAIPTGWAKVLHACRFQGAHTKEGWRVCCEHVCVSMRVQRVCEHVCGRAHMRERF